MGSDQLLHALAFDDRARIVVTNAQNTVQKAVHTHATMATASAAIGRALIAVRLMQATVKAHQRITIQIQGGGPLGLLLARGLPDGSVYGAIGSPHIHLPPRPDGKLDVGRAVGADGTLMVTKDSKDGKPYTSQTPLISGEIGEDIAHHLANSEQIRSALGLGILMGSEGEVRGAGGFLLQILGGLESDEISELEERITQLHEISRDLESGQTAEDIVDELTNGDYRIIGKSSVRYHCPNDRNYYRDRLRSLGEDDLRDIFDEDQQISLTCEYTKKTYEFERSEFADILDDDSAKSN